MTPEELLDYCLAKPGAYIDFPFGPQVTTARVTAAPTTKGPIFLELFELNGQQKATFRCRPEDGLHWRAMFPGLVTRGYHCPPAQQPYANTVTLDGSLPADVLKEMADDSWRLMVAKLPRWAQRKLLGEDTLDSFHPEEPRRQRP
jgi:predicted DNA-binding protein (MmcQ/YjbR family)